MGQSRDYDKENGAKELERNLIIGGVSLLLVTIGLVLIAVALAANAETTGPSVEVVRDLLIILLALEFVVMGAAATVLLIQVARIVNLINNEVHPLLDSATETVNTVKGTAQFLSKHLAEPVMAANSTLGGLAKVAGDVDAIRKVVDVATAVTSAASPTSTYSVSPVSSGSTITQDSNPAVASDIDKLDKH